MLFNSHAFIFVFCPLVFAVFFMVAARNFRLALAWLTGASLFFYAWWNPPYLVLLVGSVLFNYAVGLLLNGSTRGRKALLTVGVAANLLLLGYFKYTDFLIGTWNALTGDSLPILRILLPLAISFHTFQQIAYLVDTYRGETRHYRFLDYLFFVVFFPQLIAGPIVRHDEVIPQIADRRTWRPAARDLALGITIFSFGLFKKVVLADYVAIPADLVFAAASEGLGFFEAWIGAFAYALQIYFDFSAYSDMAIGLALIAGIRFPLNFFSPYQAGSIIDFWRRWHMTLSRFLLYYVYIPFGGNRRGPGRRYANLMATMLLGGLWHGAAWTFVFWGGLHGAYLAINHAWSGTRLAAAWADARTWRVTSIALTFLAVCVAWVFFRAPTFAAAWDMIAAMAGLNGLRPSVSHLPDAKMHTRVVLGGLVMVFAIPNIYVLMERFRPVLTDVRALRPVALSGWARWSPAGAWAVASALAFCTAALLINKESPFLYFQF